MTVKALTVAGSDSGGCAGIQADLKTFSALGVFGMSAVTSVTSQNTLGVSYVEALSARSVASQIDAVMSDIGADAVKTGMLYSREIIAVVADRIKHWQVDNLVVDPVMVSSTGGILLKPEDVHEMMTHLLPLARVITPNIPEAEALTGVQIKTHADKMAAFKVFAGKGVRSVLLKGGHSGQTDGKAVDVWFDGKSVYEFTSPWVDTRNVHGTGCTLSSAIAAYLARSYTMEESIRLAKNYIYRAIDASNNLSVGSGNGPVDHFWAYKNEK